MKKILAFICFSPFIFLVVALWVTEPTTMTFLSLLCVGFYFGLKLLDGDEQDEYYTNRQSELIRTKQALNNYRS